MEEAPMNTRTPVQGLVLTTLLFAVFVTSALAQLSPPVADKRPKIDAIHGDRRQDDYYWLREKTNPEVEAYLNAENAYAEHMLAHTESFQENLYDEMLSRIKQTDLEVPYRDGEYFYYSRTEEGKQYEIYCRKKGSLDAPEEIVLDLNVLAEGQTFMALGDCEVSDDANLLAYSTDSTGFREYTLQFKDLRTGALLPDRIEKVRSVAWAADNRTLFYTTEDHAKRPHQIFRHVLGSEVDELLYEEVDELYRVWVERTRSKTYILFHSDSHTTSEVRALPAAHPVGYWKMVLPRVQDRECVIEHHGDHFYMLVNDTGRNFRLVSAPVSDPQENNWQELIPHRDDVMLERLDCFMNHYVVRERKDGLPGFRVCDFRTGAVHRVEFQEPVYDAYLWDNYEWSTSLLRYKYQSFVTPSSVFDYDMNTREKMLLKQDEVLGEYDPAEYTSERIYARATDGTRIPVSIVYRKGFARNGRAPMFLIGYGSYGWPYRIRFSSNRLSLLDRGVVFAIAHIRGGGEMGKKWHDQGRMKEKINTFTDFIAVSEHLIEEKYTSRDRLVIRGASAGGLLMGAVANMRPDLFRAIVNEVPFVDVLNTMLDASLPLTVGEYEEWGDPNIEEDYMYIKQYCPYTNLEAKDYPAMLVKTSFNDSQVMYWEPAKYVAKLRSLKTDDNPLLFVINMGAGHGGASGRYDYLREIALDYAFVLWQVGIEK
jgi:oligopeptidase B